MLTLIATIAKFLAGLVDLVQSFVKEHDDEQLRQQGRLEEVAKQQEQKTTDEQIAKQIDSEPTPADKHRILDGM